MAWTGPMTLLIAAAAPLPAGAQPTIDGGTISGTTEDGIAVYRGIPFAAPPVAENRWRAPQPVTPWQGTRRAEAFAPDCAQLPVDGDAAPLGTASSEDCLYLNVWAPTPKGKGKPKPVIVWLYGGGFVNGGSSPDVYSGASFARDDVVMVSFNYRLGRFGTFAHPALGNASPNFALMDQIAALEWVQRNIAQFGGDPARVTLFGESAGGQSIHLLLAAPRAAGLFHRAIIQSGFGGDGPRNPLLPIGTLAKAEETGAAFARSQGIEGSDAKAAAALRALPVEAVLGGLNMTTMWAQAPTYTGPVVDGTIVPQSPWQAQREGTARTVPILIGANGAEGMATGKAKDAIFAELGPLAAMARQLYDPADARDAAAIEVEMIGDRLMLETTRSFAAMMSPRQPVWQYRFDYVAQAMADDWRQGAPHATEIPYVMDSVAARYKDGLTPPDAAVARQFHAYWVNFAKTGNPNGAGLPDWPAYQAKEDRLLLIDRAGTIAAAPDPAKPRLDAVHALLPR